MPPALNRLPELGLNLLWFWNHSMRAVFRRLDPAAWKASRPIPGQLKMPSVMIAPLTNWGVCSATSVMIGRIAFRIACL